MKITPQLSEVNITPELIEEIKNTDIKQFQKTKTYEKYCKSATVRKNKLKKQIRINWWKSNWIGIVSLIATLLTLIATILFGLLQLSR